MSLAYAQKDKHTLWATSIPYSITTPRGRVVADRMVRAVPLELIGRVFLTSLIILDVQGIDVILGMNWMKRHKVIFDISARLIHLLLVSMHLFTLLSPKVWMRYLWYVNI
jgi:hypothetical protein